MFTNEALIDMHARVHGGLATLLDHCRAFEADAFVQEHAGFGYPSLHLQLHHVIGAERYWVGVLEGRIDVQEDEGDHRTVETLEGLRRDVAATTDAYLRRTSPDELSATCPMTTWNGSALDLVPGHVILRIMTHVYHHQGQMTGMCRLLGRPINGLDYPHGPENSHI